MWNKANVVCQSYGLSFVSFETLEEMNAVTAMFSTIDPELTLYMFVGASTTIGESQTEWFWRSSGRKIAFAIPWGEDEPNNSGGREYCMSMRREYNGAYTFNDINCDETYHEFICQRLESSIPHI